MTDTDRPVDVGDPRRLALIARLQLQDRFDDSGLHAAVTSVAAGLDVPVASITIITPNRQVYPNSIGLDLTCTELPDQLSFCAEVVRTGRRLLVPDAADHPVFRHNPLVIDGAISSYAGAPLMHDGHAIGAVAAVDTRPRTFTTAQVDLLEAQAQLAAAVIALRSTALYDRLTGLRTRVRLLDETRRALERVKPVGERTGMLVLDVVDMTGMNERLGSAGGDHVLRAVARRMAAGCGPTDLCARIGGDKFAVLLDHVLSLDHARARAAAIVDAVQGSLEIEDATVDLDVRFGLSTTPTASADALLAAGERAATKGMRRSAPASAGVVLSTQAEELRRAIARNELVLRYHPVVDLRDGTIRGAEALVRWQHRERGLLPPSEFIALAEESGLIDDLGGWVLREAAGQAARWHAAGHEVDVAVNLSPLQMADGDLPERIAAVLAEAGGRAEQIILEVTESAVIDQPQADVTLAALRQQGIRLALDDFGTGYASLSYLRRFPFDIVKVDRSFVAGLGRHHDDDAIVGSVVSLARNTGKSLVAEGIETAAQAQALRVLGVEQGQGFWWTRPLPAAEFMHWAARVEKGGRAARPPA